MQIWINLAERAAESLHYDPFASPSPRRFFVPFRARRERDELNDDAMLYFLQYCCFLPSCEGKMKLISNKKKLYQQNFTP